MQEIILLIIFTSPLWFGIYCARNANKVLMPYEIFHIVGRFKSFLFTLFFGSGIFGLVMSLVMMIYGETFGYSQKFKIFSGLIVPEIICSIVGVLIYRSVATKCPKGPLKNRLIWSMTVSGLGSIFRVIFFFINIVAEAVEPKKAVDDKGRTIYIFPDNNVYDESGNWVGKKTNSDTYARLKNKIFK